MPKDKNSKEVIPIRGDVQPEPQEQIRRIPPNRDPDFLLGVIGGLKADEEVFKQKIAELLNEGAGLVAQIEQNEKALEAKDDEIHNLKLEIENLTEKKK